MDHKFKEGQEVFAKIDPDQKLIIRRYLKGIYYCRFPDQPAQKELVFFERELLSNEPHI